jgi:hypothetical protein
MQYHPDRCAPELRASAEHKFKDVKQAYESILKGEAGPACLPWLPGCTAALLEATEHSCDGHGPMSMGTNILQS